MHTNNNTDKDLICDDFQNQISKLLIRHKSILDILSKKNQYNARIDGAITKSVTKCGCIAIDAKEQKFSGESYEDIVHNVDTHLNGQLCESCSDIVEMEIGSYLFYLASLCNTLDLNLNDIISKELDRNKTLGIYSLK